MAHDVVLIFPGKYRSPFLGMPIVLLYLAAPLIKRGYSVRLVDTRVERLQDLDLGNPVCVGISSMTGHQILYGIESARHIRKVSPGTPIIWGGVHPTMLPEETLKSQYVDMIVRGEGEEALLELVQRLERREDVSGIKGIGYKSPGGEIRLNPHREPVSLDDIPMELPYRLLKLDKYSWDFFIQTSRGCPHKCGYCCNTFYYWQGYRSKSPGRVIAEMEYMADEFGLKKLGFDCDDAFFADRERARQICGLLAKKKMGLGWSAPSRFDYFLDCDENFIRLVAESGCTDITFGGDSGSERILKFIRKDMSVETMRQALERIKKYAGTGIRIDVNFIFGFPGETSEDMESTLRLMDRLSVVYPGIRYGITSYTPYPGTPLYETAVKDFGFVPPSSFEEWGDYNFGSFRAPWNSGEYAELIDTLSAISRVDFSSSEYTIPRRFGKFPYSLMYRMLSSMAHARWKKKFFALPFEWRIARSYVENRRGYF